MRDLFDAIRSAQNPYASQGGGSPGRVSTTSAYRDPNRVLGDVARQERLYYDQVFRPLNRDLIEDVDSTKLVDTARENADSQYEAAQARSKRQQMRFGANPTALDRHVQDRAAGHSRGLNYDNLVNSARLSQYDRNVGLRNELINTSRGIAKSAMDGLGEAAQMQTQRENNNNAIEAQNEAQKQQMWGSLAGTAIMAAMMM